MSKRYWLLALAVGALRASAAEAEGPVVVFNGAVLECDQYGCRERLAQKNDQPRDAEGTDDGAAAERSRPEPVPYTAITYSPAPDPPSEEETQREKDDLKAQQSMALWALWMVIATFAGVVLILWTLVEARRTSNLAARSLRNALNLGRMQMREARKATAAAVKTISVTQTTGEKQIQAYLICNKANFWLREHFDQDARRIDLGITCKLLVANKGQSPGRKVRIEYTGRVWRELPEQKGFWKPYQECHEDDAFTADVGPQDQEHGIIEFPLLTPEQLQTFEQSHSYVEIKGTLNWVNEFEHPQTQDFTLHSGNFWKSAFSDEKGRRDPSVTLDLTGVGRR